MTRGSGDCASREELSRTNSPSPAIDPSLSSGSARGFRLDGAERNKSHPGQIFLGFAHANRPAVFSFLGAFHHLEIERIEQIPWFNFIYGALTGNDCEAEAAVTHLREWPLDLVIHSYQNSHRADLQTPPGYTA